MSISSEVRKAGPFTGNGVTTAFPFAFKVFSSSQIRVVRQTISTGAEVDLVLTTDYTVSLNGNQDSNPGGTVNLLAPLASTFKLTIASQVQNLQPTVLTNAGGFYPTVINDSLDRATILVQQLNEKLDRSIKYPISDPSLGTEVPTATARANKVLSFDANGVPIAEISATDVADAQENAASAAASAAEALTYLNNLKGQYYGPLSSDPTQDPLGNPIGVGDLYFNSTLSILKVYNGTIWEDALTFINDSSVTTAKIANSAVTNAKLANMPATTIKGNPTTSSAAPQDISISSGMFYRNKIINGGMRIDQRNNGGAITTNGFPVDRFFASHDIGSFTFSSQRSTTAPNGFINSLQFTATNAQTPSVSQQCNIGQIIEGNMVSDLSFGTASASVFTLSFWVRSSVAGTYCVSFRNSAENRSYVAEYSIILANTWEYKTITVQGDTSGTWLTDTGRGLAIAWNLSGGSSFNTTAGAWSSGNFLKTSSQVNFTGNSGATFFLTGVQLEQGSLATPFERRPWAVEDLLCKRYFYGLVAGLDTAWHGVIVGNAATDSVQMPVQMRVAPSVSFHDLATPPNFGRISKEAVNNVTGMSISLTSPNLITWRSGITGGSNNELIRFFFSCSAEF